MLCFGDKKKKQKRRWQKVGEEMRMRERASRECMREERRLTHNGQKVGEMMHVQRVKRVLKIIKSNHG